MNTPPPERLAYSVKEVAILLGIGRSLVYKLIHDGELPAIKIHADRRVTKAALDTYMPDDTLETCFYTMSFITMPC